MTQKLSAIKYIKNNKRRVTVLIISLGLCFMLTYLTQFLLSSSIESFYPILLKSTLKIQYMSIAGSSFGIDVNNPDIDFINAEYDEKINQLIDKLKTWQGINNVYYAQVIYFHITPPIGSYSVIMPLIDKEDISIFLEHMDAKLIDGRLPEYAGEVIFDKASMKNNNYALNDYIYEEYYDKSYKIVGILDCDNYFGCGIPSGKYEHSQMIATLSDGSIKNMSLILKAVGVNVRDSYDSICDYQDGVQSMAEINQNIERAINYIYIGIMILLTISLFVVYTTYLRDRHNEWCLYCSIGYSRKTIYFSILRELLFTFITAIMLGGIIIFISILTLDYTMIRSMGLKCRYFYPKSISEIICSYMLLLGFLQIPISYALFKIRTIDAIDDELY